MDNSIFSDPVKAFEKISNKQLKHEISVFRLINRKFSRLKVTRRLLKYSLWIPGINILSKWFLKKNIFSIFCGGETVKQCLPTISRLAENNVTTILDFSKESGNNQSYDYTLREILKTVNAAKDNRNISFAVFKVTGLGSNKILEKISNGTASQQEKETFLKVKERVNTLCHTACRNNLKILIDAEESWYQKAIDDLAEEMIIKYNKNGYVVYNTVQLYRKDRLQYLKRTHQKLSGLGIKSAFKLVRGAYMEGERKRAMQLGYASPIHNTEEDTHKDYNLALEYFAANPTTMAICVGTHNEYSCNHLISLMKYNNIQKNDERIYFAQLLGMADNISNPLGNEGYYVAKYVPYGPVKATIPYLIRRADENKSITGEIPREIAVREQVLAARKQKI